MLYKKQEYAYIVGRLRALETRLISPNLVERMVDASTPQDAFRVLNDITYLSGSIGEYAVNDFQKVLSLGLQKMVRLLSKIAPYPEVVDSLLMKYDFHNLKVVLKARLTGRGYSDVEHALIDLGNYSKEEWENYLLTDEIGMLTDTLQKTVDEATEYYNKTSDSLGVDLIVDKAFNKENYVFLQSLDSDLILGFGKRSVDFQNIKTFLRCEILKKDQSYLDNMLSDGGVLPTSLFSSAYKDGVSALRDALSGGYDIFNQTLEERNYCDQLVLLLDDFAKEKNFSSIEKRIAGILGDYISESQMIALGPEPLFAFFWKFENHIQIIRSIFIGKLNGLPSDEIRKYLFSL